jgi:hypothetical protein
MANETPNTGAQTVDATYKTTDAFGNSFTLFVRDGNVTCANRRGIATCLSKFSRRGNGYAAQRQSVVSAAQQGLGALNSVSIYRWEQV